MTGESRGEDYQIHIVGEDGVIEIVQPDDMDFSPEQNRDRQERCGDRRQPVRQTFAGWSGSATFEQESFGLDDVIDSITGNYFAGEEVQDHEIYHTKYIPKLGATRTYRYYGVKFSVDESAGGQKDPVERTLEWDAEGREIV